MVGILQNIILVFILYERHIHSAEFCDQRDIGYYADPTSCYKYYHCDGLGTTFQFDCSFGTIWSDELQTCDIDPYYGNCVPLSASHTCGCYRYRVNSSMRYVGPEVVDTIFKDSIIGCAKACKQNPNLCQGFNFFPVPKICELYSGIQPAIFIPDVSCHFGQLYMDGNNV